VKPAQLRHYQKAHRIFSKSREADPFIPHSLEFSDKNSDSSQKLNCTNYNVKVFHVLNRHTTAEEVTNISPCKSCVDKS